MKRVAVVRGGPSAEHEVSLRTGKAILNSLQKKGYITKDIVITRSGEWLDSGLVRNPEQALTAVDVVFIGLHGTYGEDGQLQKYLETHKIPFTGSRSMASGLAFNKLAAKSALRDFVTTPKHHVLKGESLWSVASFLDELIDSLGNEIFIKPVADGSSNASYRIISRESLENALDVLLPTHKQILAEEFVYGREATVAVLEDFRGEAVYAMPAIEILPPHDQAFYSNAAKYGGKTEFICPGRFTYEEKQKMTDMAIAAHTQLNCSHYSRSDFIVREGEVYFLEINTLPGLTEHSLFPRAARTIGLEFDDLVEHLLQQAK